MSSLDEVLAKRTAPEANDLFGVVLSAFDKTGKTIIETSAGRQSWEKPGPIDPNGTFWIASCTKLLTTICALQCVERGQIGLDDDVTQSLLPELKNPEIITLDNPPEDPSTLVIGQEPVKGSFTIAPANDPKITLRQLLTHTSGVGYDFMSPLLMGWRASKGSAPLTLSGKVMEAFTAPLLYEPGKGWAYGGGVDLAGEIVARLNKTTLGKYMEENMFKPLGMDSSTFHLEGRPDIKERMVQMSARTEDGGLVGPAPSPIPEVMRDESGGAGLMSSVPDYTKVLLDLISDEPKLLKKETVGSMFAPQFGSDSLSFRDLSMNKEIYGAMTGGAATDEISFALGGLYLGRDMPTLPAGSLVWGGLPNLVWFANRQKGIAGMYASQMLPPGEPKSAEMVREFLKEVRTKARI